MQVEKLDELVQEMGAVRKIVGTHEYENQANIVKQCKKLTRF